MGERRAHALALIVSALLLAPVLTTADAIMALVGGALTDHEFLGGGPYWGVRAYAVALWAAVLALAWLGLLEAAVVGTAALIARARPDTRLATPIAVALWSSPLACFLGSYLLSGGAMRRALASPGWRVGLAVALVALAFGSARLWLARVEPLGRSLATRAALLGAALALLALDRLVLTGLYPPLHALLVLGAVLVGQRLIWERVVAAPPRGARAIVLATVLVAILGGVPILLPWETRPFENFVVGRFAIFSGKALALAGSARRSFAPPEPRLPSPSAQAPGERRLRRVLGANQRWPDLYVIFVDGLSPFRTSLEGHDRDTTPFLASLSRTGVYFPRAYSPAPGTIGSLRSILSGRFQHEEKAARSPFSAPLLDRLRALGYLTYCDVPFLERTLSQARCDLQVNIERADWSRDSLVSYLSSARAPVFALVLLSATHYPFQLLPGPRYGSSREGRYDAALAATDRLLRELHGRVARLGRDARYVITGDHGHAFGWHGLHGHNSSLYEDQIRVPLLLSGFPARPRRVEVPISLLDLTATLAGGIGADLAPILEGAPARAAEAAPVAAFHGERGAIVDGDLKLIRDPTLGSAELYDLRADPKEQRNLVAARPEAASGLRAALERLRPFAP
jgi:hypothetical protein